MLIEKFRKAGICSTQYVAQNSIFSLESAADHQIFLETAENILLQLNNYDKAEYKIIASDLNFGNCFL